MALFKCKMCGGELNVQEGMTVCECEYCGTKQTLPKLDDEKRINLYERANHFRRNNEFDKAAGFYETILAEDKTDAEAYWSLVLCKYGIEYVEDPATHKRIPTVNRAQYTSVLIDENYQSAMKYADGYQRDVYETEAKAIDEIQKGILEISNKEEPFDVFICYKETNSDGSRTKDSVYAQEIYDALTKEGYRVFFSRITLEDKLGTAYEPYIFAALNSSKVMITVGTSRNNLNSVWVKNEWSRYLALIKNGEDKNLIPVYSDMDAYDLPDEFSYLQSQDRNKVGFMQDLVRGVKKLISQDVIDTRQKAGTTSVIVDTMMNRATTALANGEWDTAKRCYNSVLDYDNKNIDAHLGILLSDNNVDSIERLTNSVKSFEKDKNYLFLIANADREMVKQLELCNKTVLSNINKDKKKKNTRITITLIILIVLCFSGFLIFRYIIIPNNNYNLGVSYYESKNYKTASLYFKDLGDYKDSKEYLQKCWDNIIFALNSYEEQKAFYINYYAPDTLSDDECDYQLAKFNMENEKFDSAARIFTEECPGYLDSDELIIECYYLNGCKLLEKEYYYSAKTYFEKCKNYKDANEKLEICISAVE